MANFWQKIFENGNIFGNNDFLLQNGIFLAIFILRFFAIHIFFIVLNFLSLAIKKRSVSWESKCVVRRRNISSSLNQWFSKLMDSTLGGDFKGQGGKETKGVIGGGKTTQRSGNAQPLIDH